MREFDPRLLSNAERNIRAATGSANTRAGAIRRRYIAALSRVDDHKGDAISYYHELERMGLATTNENVKTEHEAYLKFESELRAHRINWQLVLPIHRPQRRPADQPMPNA
jgi:hypothetical protein